jgi:hypothetical protein
MNFLELISRIVSGVVFQWWGPLLAVIVFIILVTTRRAVKARAEPFTLRVAFAGALAIALAWAFVQVGAPFLGSEPWQVRWELFLPPILAAIVALAVVFVHVVRAPSKPEAPVMPVVRRGWLSFSRRQDWVVATAAGGALLLISIAAGFASTPDEDGLYSLISIPNGDTEAGWSTFFGWAYSLPLLACVAVLATLAFLSLRIDADRPFMRPQTVAAETEARRSTAEVIWALSGAALLIALSDALFMIAGAGMGYAGVGIPGVGTFTFSTGFAAIAPALWFMAGALQAAAAFWLLLTNSGRRLSRGRVS